MKTAAIGAAAVLAAMQPSVSAAQARPSAARTGTELTSVGHDTRGNAQCVFKALPNLKLTDGSEHSAELTILARGSGMGQTYLTVRFFQGTSGPQWRGLGVSSNFSVLNPAFETARPVWATVLIDGVPSQAGAVLNWDYGNRSRVEVRAAPQAAAQRVAELGDAMVATLNILDPSRQTISTHIFDVAMLRQVPDLLAASGWKCPAAAPVSGRATPAPLPAPNRTTPARTPAVNQAVAKPAPVSDAAAPVASADTLAQFGAMLDTELRRYGVPSRNGRYRYEGSSPCHTRYRRELDATVVDGVETPASVEQLGIDWPNVVFADKDRGPVEYVTLTFRDGHVLSVKVPAEQRDSAVGLARQLMTQCAGSSRAPERRAVPSHSMPVQTLAPASMPASAPTQAPIAATQPRPQQGPAPLDPRWRLVRGGTANVPTCTYDGLPMLTVTQNQSIRLELGAGQRYGSGMRQTQPGHRFIIQYVLGNAGLAPDRPMFVADLPGDDDRGVAEIRVLLDGVRFVTSLDTSSYASGGSRHFLAVVRDEDEFRFGQQFVRANAMQWQLVSRDGRIIYEANIDLGVLASVDEAINQSRLRCPAQ